MESSAIRTDVGTCHIPATHGESAGRIALEDTVVVFYNLQVTICIVTTRSYRMIKG
jgi:hypothetical protein